MRLYYFTNERFGLAAISDRRLKIARIDELNDPFEFLSLAVNRKDRVALNRFKNAMASRYGMICLSKDWSHPLLWGHYADKHRGIALGFDVDKPRVFQPVTYHPDRLTIQEFGVNSVCELGEAHVLKLLSTKFSAWSYESEYRAFCRLDERDPISGLYFLPFSPIMRLAHVMIGARCKLRRNKLSEVLSDYNGSVTSFKVRPAFKKFEVVENKRQKA